jgi:predicted nucleotidyltransferase
MPFSDAIRALNQLKRRRIIRDYALIGSVAATAYVEPIYTQDLDIVVLVDTDEEYLATFRRVVEQSEGIEGMHVVLNETPVQMFPTTVKPLYLDILIRANTVRVGNLRVKVASPEHLILLCLEAFRDKDQQRIRSLLSEADINTVLGLLEEFDDDGTLTARLKNLR